MNVKRMAIGFAAAAFVGLLVLSLPVSAGNGVLLECVAAGDTYKSSRKVDYDNRTVTDYTPEVGGTFQASITADTITWSQFLIIPNNGPGMQLEYTLDRNTGVLTAHRHWSNGKEIEPLTWACTVKHTERF